MEGVCSGVEGKNARWANGLRWRVGRGPWRMEGEMVGSGVMEGRNCGQPLPGLLHHPVQHPFQHPLHPGLPTPLPLPHLRICHCCLRLLPWQRHEYPPREQQPVAPLLSRNGVVLAAWQGGGCQQQARPLQEVARMHCLKAQHGCISSLVASLAVALGGEAELTPLVWGFWKAVGGGWVGGGWLEMCEAHCNWPGQGLAVALAARLDRPLGIGWLVGGWLGVG